MSKQAEQDLANAVDALRAENPNVDNEMDYWQARHDVHNTTGKSLMQLNETKEGEAIANEICRKIGADMVAKFGEDK